MIDSNYSRLKQHLEIVTSLSKSMFRNNTVDDVLWDIVSNCVNGLKFVDCIIYLVNGPRNALIRKVGYSDDDNKALDPLKIEFGEGIVGKVALSGVAEIISNTQKNHKPAANSHIGVSEIAVPIFHEDKVIGIINGRHGQAGFYDDFHLHVLNDIAAISGMKMASIFSKKERDDLAVLLLGNPNPVLQVSSSFEIMLSNEEALKITRIITQLDEDQRYDVLYSHVESALKSNQPVQTDLYLGEVVYSVEIIPFSARSYANLYLEDVTAYMQAKNDAEQAMQAKADFISDMSHEIRTPLNGILNLNRLLKKSEVKPKRIQMFEAIEYSGENLLTIINTILEYEKLGAGKVVFQKNQFDIKALLKNLHRLMLPEANKKSIDLRFDIDEKVPGFLVGDEIRLLQILNNLLLNALKFTNEGSVSLNVALKSKALNEVILEFSIVDTGIGIADNEVDLIFNKYVQVFSGDRRSYGGTGLGLSITRRLVEQQGGAISIKSKVNVGSCFTILMPYTRVSKAITKVDNSTLASKIDLSGYRVLIVDDSPINVLAAEQFLLSWSVKVFIAQDGFEAIKICRSQALDLILMDLQMPGIDGFETTKLIRKRSGLNSRVPIIAMSADVLNHPKDEITQAGLNESLTKPFSPDVLKLVIYKYVKENINLT